MSFTHRALREGIFSSSPHHPTANPCVVNEEIDHLEDLLKDSQLEGYKITLQPVSVYPGLFYKTLYLNNHRTVGKDCHQLKLG